MLKHVRGKHQREKSDKSEIHGSCDEQFVLGEMHVRSTYHWVKQQIV